MAKMCGMLVRICLSTGMKPRSVTATPAWSAASLPPLGVRPTETSTRSYFALAGTDAPSNVACSPSFFASTLATLQPRCTATPRFLSRSAKGLTRSLSAPGISWSMNSTTVTVLPKAE